jgi:hypothetical protein
MAKKTTSIIKEVTPEPVEKLKIDELNLLRLTRLTEKIRATGLELQMAGGALNGLFQKFLVENEDAKKLNTRITELQLEQRKADEQYKELVKKIGENLKVDMAKFAYDDETGELSPVP